MGLVGRIIVSSTRAEWTETLSRRLGDWLVEKKWEKSVSVDRRTKRGAAPLLEVVFHPGEYQSNRRRRFKFSSLARTEKLESALHRWLFEIER